MSCSNLTAGITTGCNNSIGGIQTIYIANGYTSYVTTNGVITAFNGISEWYTFDVDTGAASFTETYEVNKNASILGFRQSVTIQLNGLNADIQQTVAEIAESNTMLVVIKDNNDNYWTVGIDRGAYLESGSTTTGVAYTDTKAATLTITGVELESTKPVEPVAVGTNWLPIISWTETTQCNAQGTATIYPLTNLTTAQAKCEYDTMQTLVQTDALGCYPSLPNATVTYQLFKIPLGTVVGLGTQLYFLNGNPATTTRTFWAKADQSIQVSTPLPEDTGSGWTLPLDLRIGRMVNGIITEWDVQSNYTCIP